VTAAPFPLAERKHYVRNILNRILPSDNGNWLLVLGFVAVIVEVVRSFLPKSPLDTSRIIAPIAFAWAALIIAKNLGWPATEQRDLSVAVFIGCLGLMRSPTAAPFSPAATRFLDCRDREIKLEPKNQNWTLQRRFPPPWSVENVVGYSLGQERRP
jgi:hypothetical protein